MVKNAVVRIDRSPMNPRIWVLQLDCWHDIYITAERRPVRKTAKCEKCAALAAKEGR